MDLLAALDLTRYFPVVIGGDSCPVKKPDPTPIKSPCTASGRRQRKRS
jgi:phosphoglycolate phosphatase